MEKARQIIYSVFMGFVLKYFLQNAHKAYKHWEQLNLDTNQKIIYILILSYFFLNAFRYLFGIFRFVLMTDKDYSPNENDWNFELFGFNLKRKFVLNSGLFLVILFGACSLFLFPSYNEVFNWSSEFLNKSTTSIDITKKYHININEIMMTFLLFHIAISFLDWISVLVFQKTASRAGSTIDEEEKISLTTWKTSSFIELVVFCLLTLHYWFHNSEYIIEYIGFFLIYVLLFFEFLDIYNYSNKLILKIKKALKLSADA